MKKFLLLVVLSILLVMTTSVALAEGKYDQSKVGFFDKTCTIDAGKWGVLTETDAWFAKYSNGVIILKCLGHVGNPPEKVFTYSGLACEIPGDSTTNSRVKVFPDGKVSLICKFVP